MTLSFRDLLTKHALVVLNSWHDPEPATYHGPAGRTQIDFIATRHRAAGVEPSGPALSQAFR